MVRLVVAAFLIAVAPFVSASASTGDAGLPREVVDLLAAEPLPEQSLDPRGRYLVLVHRPGLLPMEQVDRPTVSVSGLRINPFTHARDGAMPYSGLSLVDLASGERHRLPVPDGAGIGYPRWSPDGERFFFAAAVDDGIELWTVERGEQRPRRLLGTVLSAALTMPCGWMPDGRYLVCRIVAGGESGSEGLLRSQLVLVDAASGGSRPLGEPAVFDTVEPSPNGNYLLVERRSPVSGNDRSSRVYEIWDISGTVVETLEADSSVPRATHWQPSAPSTLVWVERYGQRDRIMSLPVPTPGPARMLFETQRRFAGLRWLEGANRALFSEYDPQERVTRLWLIGSGVESPKLLGIRDVDGGRRGVGYPMTTQNGAGKTVVPLYDGGVLVRGETGTTHGRRPYLARVDLDTTTVETLWLGDDPGREELLGLIGGNPRLLLTRHEGRLTPPDYRVRDLESETIRPITTREHPVPAMLDIERRVLRYRRDDGLHLSATLYLPPHAAADEPLPLILWAYPRQYNPGTDPPALADADRFVDVDRSLRLFFVLLGYAVMDDVAMPVMGEPREANDTFVEQIVENARAAIDAGAATGLVDSARVGVAGHSYGAFMAANLLAHSRLFGAGVGLSGAYNRTLTPFGFQTERRTLWEARETYLRMSPFLYSDRIGAPLLLVHGMMDDNAGTSPMQSRFFHEAIVANGGTSDLMLLPHEGHVYRGRQSVLDTAAAMARWFDEYLRKPGSPREAGSTTAMSSIPQIELTQ